MQKVKKAVIPAAGLGTRAYGEGMLDYNRFHSMLRVGICIKPQFFSDY